MNLFDQCNQSVRMAVWAGPELRFSDGQPGLVSYTVDNIVRRGVRSPLWELVWREVWSSVYVHGSRSTEEHIREFS